MTIKQITQYIKSNDVKNALRGASEHKDLLGDNIAVRAKRAYECIVHSEFYKQIGRYDEREINVVWSVIKYYYLAHEAKQNK